MTAVLTLPLRLGVPSTSGKMDALIQTPGRIARKAAIPLATTIPMGGHLEFRIVSICCQHGTTWTKYKNTAYSF